MNILPKKRWHVRTRDNIARVRRDEAKAAEDEKKKQLQVEVAEKEARTEFMRQRAKEQYGNSGKQETKKETKTEPGFSSDSHVNLFYELERNEIVSNKTNADHELEKKLEKEKYEKQIGYLTYLGQDTNEMTGNISWYNKVPDRNLKREKDPEEVSIKEKALADPLSDIRHYLGTKGVKTIASTSSVESSQKHTKLTQDGYTKQKKKKSKDKKHKSSKKKNSKHSKKSKRKRKRSPSSSSSDEQTKSIKLANFEKLRQDRLNREKEEGNRAALHLAKIRGDPIEKPKDTAPVVIQKYNSQFNPHLANQNFRD